MDLIDPGLMSDFELLTHVHTVHGPIPGLVYSPEYMTDGVMLSVRDMHDREHNRTNHHHWHDYILWENPMLDDQTGVWFRSEPVGLDKRSNIWMSRCGEPNCYFMCSSTDESKVRARFDNHTCPQESGTTHYGASVTISLIEECWGKADVLYAKLQNLDDQASNEALFLKHELRGMCKVLAVFVSPFFKTFQEVATEIAKRYNLREAGQEYETPGTQTRVFDLPKPVEERQKVQERAQKVLSEDERKALKFAADSGMFTVAELARTYSVSEAVVREVSS